LPVLKAQVISGDFWQNKHKPNISKKFQFLSSSIFIPVHKQLSMTSQKNSEVTDWD